MFIPHAHSPIAFLLIAILALSFSLNASAASDDLSLSDAWTWPESVTPGSGLSKAQLLEEQKALKKQNAILPPDQLYRLAVLHLIDGEYKKSIDLANILVTYEAYQKKALYLQGINVFYRNLSLRNIANKWDIRGLQPLEEALKIDENDPRTWIAILTYLQAGPRPSANRLVRSYFPYLKKKYIEHFGAHLLAGTMHQIRTQFDQAEEEFLAAYQMAPDNPAPLFALVQHYRHRGWDKLERSVICLRALVALDWDPRFKKELEKDEQVLKRFNRIKETGKMEIAPPASGADYRLPFPAGKAYYLARPSINHLHRDRGRYAYDFLMPVRAEVCAARSGVLVKKYQLGTPKDSHEMINHAVIDHGDGTYARYYHLRSGSIRIPEGTYVRAGEVIGQCERSRLSQSGHLHFEVVERAFWSPTSPYIYLLNKTVDVEFTEMRGMSRDQRENAWHISQNLYREDE